MRMRKWHVDTVATPRDLASLLQRIEDSPRSTVFSVCCAAAVGVVTYTVVSVEAPIRNEDWLRNAATKRAADLGVLSRV